MSNNGAVVIMVLKSQALNVKSCNRLFKGVDFEVLGKTVRAVYGAASLDHGADCLSISGVVVAFLKGLGISAKVVAGEAMWRVDGQHDGAVISHVESESPVVVMNESPRGTHLRFHAWVELNQAWFLDMTTYQFQLKMDRLDESDGGSTPVTWKPDYLLFKHSDTSTFNQVQSSFSSGLFYYKIGGKAGEVAINSLKERGVDPDDVSIFSVAYNSIKAGDLDYVVGPCGASKV
jgi:hypothetical protein